MSRTTIIVALAVLISLLIPVGTTAIASLGVKRARWVAPLVTFVVFLFLWMKSVFDNFSNVSLQQIVFYFHSDAAVEFPLFFLPVLASSLVLTLYMAVRQHRLKQ